MVIVDGSFIFMTYCGFRICDKGMSFYCVLLHNAVRTWYATVFCIPVREVRKKGHVSELLYEIV